MVFVTCELNQGIVFWYKYINTFLAALSIASFSSSESLHESDEMTPSYESEETPNVNYQTQNMPFSFILASSWLTNYLQSDGWFMGFHYNSLRK